MKKLVCVFLAVIMLLSLFTSCSGEEESELYYPVTVDFTSLDPQIVSGASSRTVAYNCYEGLVRLDENGEITAAGAASWSASQDGLTYTFNLRRDAEWYLTNTSKEALSDEDAAKSLLPENFDNRVTAKDYVFGLRRAVDPATGSGENEYFSAIKNARAIIGGEKRPGELGAEAVDDYTLRITLDYADPDFLYSLTRLAATPCNETFFNACRGRYGLSMEYILCNGAYIVYRWTQGSLIRLEKNPLYTGGGASKCDRVWVYYISDSSSVADKIKSGTYDAGFVSSSDAQEFKNSDKYTLSSESNILWCYWFNCKSSKFATVELRTAFASCVDKSVLTLPSYIENTTDRLLTDALSPYYDFTPAPIAYNEKSAEENYRAAMELNESVTASMTVTVLTDEENADSVTKQIQIWQKVFGADVKVRAETREEALKLFNSGEYEIAFLPVSITSSNTAEYWRTYTSSSDSNVTGYANPNYDALILSVTSDMSDDEKIEVYKSCEQTLISHAVAVPAFTEETYFVSGKGVSGIYGFSESEIYFRNAG